MPGIWIPGPPSLILNLERLFLAVAEKQRGPLKGFRLGMERLGFKLSSFSPLMCHVTLGKLLGVFQPQPLCWVAFITLTQT